MLKNAIPFVDLRGRSPIDLLRSYPDKARELIGCAKRMYGPASQLAGLVALPVSDRLSRAWLEHSGNPYLYEIETAAELLETRGVYTLNVCYEWGCTSGAWRTGDTVTLLRVLDWPFPGIGRHVVVALQQGKAGEFYNVTWPGVSGVFTGMAPGRFSAALNQAPMRRHGRGFFGDWLANRIMTGKATGLPPSHLLRQVFEQAETYEEAREMLIGTKLALPAIFILAGIEPGQGCVIERLEDAAEVSDLAAGLGIAAANHFTGKFSGQGRGWRPREPDSHGRWRQSCHIGEYDLNQPHFNWLQAPMVNVNTRLVVTTDAATRRLMAQGFEGMAQATGIFNLPAVAHESSEAI